MPLRSDYYLDGRTVVPYILYIDIMSFASSALEWDCQSTSGCAYWVGLEKFVERSHTGEPCCLSYPSLVYLIVSLAQKLRAKIIQQIQTELGQDALSLHQVASIPIAVAIPEGVYLPLAIAAVHVLNRPHKLSETFSIHAVLVPIDPSDGLERIKSMLDDTRPCFVLIAAERDQQRLQPILVEMQETSKFTMGSQMYRAKTMQILGIQQLLEDIRLPSQEVVRAIDEHLQRTDQSLEELCSQCETITQLQINTSASIPDTRRRNRVSHICFTSGTTGAPKGCVSSYRSLSNYLRSKNRYHQVDVSSRVLLASSVSFDPCLSDILATFTAKATLVIAKRETILQNLTGILHLFRISHCLCTPTLWSTTLTTSNNNGPLYKNLPFLQCVALGGERIPNQLKRAWAKRREDASSKFRLCATYGVTEACVYQTIGEVFWDETVEDVGMVFEGMGARICLESKKECLVDVEPSRQTHGEVVLYGNQLDEHSLYLRQEDLSTQKFVKEGNDYYYRTGDRGYIDPLSNKLRILGRIDGEEGMVKVNGVRVELSEVEAAVTDQKEEHNVVVGCMVVAEREGDESSSSISAKGLTCYMVLSKACLHQLGVCEDIPARGAICTPGSLLTLVRTRCKRSSKVMPSAFVVIPRVPLSPTGKRDCRAAPIQSSWISFGSLLSLNDDQATLLKDYGMLGKILADAIIDCLNLQPVQQALLTSNVTFGMVGGDSLAATRIIRALYALHHNVPNSRYIGGEFGILEGPFAAVHLINAKSLKSYVDMLEQNEVCASIVSVSEEKLVVDPQSETTTVGEPLPESDGNSDEPDCNELHVALTQAAVRKYTNICLALLDIGANPNHNGHKGRFGKVSGRLERKMKFYSSPLHLACIIGDDMLVHGLLFKGAEYNRPDACGMFPLHHVAAGDSSTGYSLEDDSCRKKCLDYLLKAGAALSMKDGQKQTVLHVAARAGRQGFLQYVMQHWNKMVVKDPRKVGSLEWRDTWSRTPVHWAVLNNHIVTLKILLDNGCNPCPVKVKASTSSLTPETPIEICDRIYGSSDTGEQIRKLLLQHSLPP